MSASQLKLYFRSKKKLKLYFISPFLVIQTMWIQNFVDNVTDGRAMQNHVGCMLCMHDPQGHTFTLSHDGRTVRITGDATLTTLLLNSSLRLLLPTPFIPCICSGQTVKRFTDPGS